MTAPSLPRPRERGTVAGWMSVGIGSLATAVLLFWAWTAAGANNFSLSARATTAVGGIAVVVIALLQGRLGRRMPKALWRPGRRDLVPETQDEGRGPAEEAMAPIRRHTALTWTVWGLMLAVVVAWEMVAFLHGPRSAHPTLSSMFVFITSSAAPKAAVSTSHAIKAFAFLVWLGLGTWLLRR